MKRGLVVAMAVLGRGRVQPGERRQRAGRRGRRRDANVVGPRGAGDGGLSVARACADGAFARCSRLQTCSTSAVQFRFGDLHTCEALYPERVPRHQRGAVERSDGRDGRGVRDRASAKWSCDDYLFDQNPPPDCQRPRPGRSRTARRAACGQQCQSAFCSIAPARCAGRARPRRSRATRARTWPIAALRSTASPASLKCEGYVQMGGPCTPGLPCAAGLACVGYNALSNASGTCQPEVITAGEPCIVPRRRLRRVPGSVVQRPDADMRDGAGRRRGRGVRPGRQPAGLLRDLRIVRRGGLPGGGGRRARPATSPRVPSCITLSRCAVEADGGTSGTCRIPSASTCR